MPPTGERKECIKLAVSQKCTALVELMSPGGWKVFWGLFMLLNRLFLLLLVCKKCINFKLLVEKFDLLYEALTTGISTRAKEKRSVREAAGRWKRRAN